MNKRMDSLEIEKTSYGGMDNGYVVVGWWCSW